MMHEWVERALGAAEKRPWAQNRSRDDEGRVSGEHGIGVRCGRSREEPRDSREHAGRERHARDACGRAGIVQRGEKRMGARARASWEALSAVISMRKWMWVKVTQVRVCGCR
jgi:hypothetical protein